MTEMAEIDETTWTEHWLIMSVCANPRKPDGIDENYVIICSHSGCSKPVRVSFIYWAQKKIFWRMSVTKQLILAIDLHEKNTMEVNGYHQQVWNNQSVSKWWQNFHFCVNDPLYYDSYYFFNKI